MIRQVLTSFTVVALLLGANAHKVMAQDANDQQAQEQSSSNVDAASLEEWLKKKQRKHQQ